MDLSKRESFGIPQKKLQKSEKSNISFGSLLVLSPCASIKNHHISLHITIVFSFLIITGFSVGGIIYGAVSVVNNISNILSIRLEKIKNDNLQISEKIVDTSLSDFLARIRSFEDDRTGYYYKRERPVVDDGICRAGMSLLPVDVKIEAVLNMIPDIKNVSRNYSGHALLSAFLARYDNSSSESHQFICPTLGTISSGYGVRSDPIYEGAAIHNGVDIADNFKAPVFCASSGVVLWSGYRGRWGNVVIVDHVGSGYQTIYAHLGKTVVSGGATVEGGQLIGYVGSTGRSTGPHLHYEVRFHGKPVNPVPFILPAGAVSD